MALPVSTSSCACTICASGARCAIRCCSTPRSSRAASTASARLRYWPLLTKPVAAVALWATGSLTVGNYIAATTITQVVVTHEVEFARKVASQVIYLEKGRIIESGTAAIFQSPQTSRFAEFLMH